MCHQNLRNCLRLNVKQKTLVWQKYPYFTKNTFPQTYWDGIEQFTYRRKCENFADISHNAGYNCKPSGYFEGKVFPSAFQASVCLLTLALYYQQYLRHWQNRLNSKCENMLVKSFPVLIGSLISFGEASGTGTISHPCCAVKMVRKILNVNFLRQSNFCTYFWVRRI